MTCDTAHVTRHMWHMTHYMWHVTDDMWHLTNDMWQVTHGVGWTFPWNVGSLALTFFEKWCVETDDSMNQ